MPQPRVSVIMNCLNGERYLREAIDSVYAQTFGDWEIVFWDNASTDASATIAKGHDSRLRYFRGETTVPLGAARNAALARANGEFIAFLDTDDRWLPAKLAAQVEFFRTHPAVDFLYSNFRIVREPSARRYVGYRKRQPEGRVFSAFLRHYPVNLQTVMLRKAALESMDSLFDPNFDVSEEYDLFIRMLITRQAGYLHEPLVQYRIHQNMASIRRFERYPVENRLILGKLRVLDPALDEKYRNEVRYLEAKIGYWEAAASMRRGDLAGARQDLAPHKSVTLVFLALYCATFLPPAVWNKLHELRFALKSPVSPAE